jgi:hypothetical protein
MPIAGCSKPEKPSESKEATRPPASAVQACGSADGPSGENKTSGDKIEMVFDPAKSKKVQKCDRIVHVQFCRMTADGKVIKPGNYSSRYKARDSATTDAGWYVDPSDPGFKTPDYQQSGTPRAIGNDGKKNGSVVKAKTEDVPQTGGGDKGFYDPLNNKGGWKKVRYEFATFGYCMAGPDCGKWYEGFQWTYEKTSADQKAGSNGTSTITDRCVDAPSGKHLAAFDKFNKREGFTPCK